MDQAKAQGEFDWRWRDASSAVNQAATPNGVFVFEAGGPEGIGAGIVFSDRSGHRRWAHPAGTGPGREAFLLPAGEALYAALYSPSATGCRVLALDLASGRTLWETPLIGIGSVMHSRYRNKVQMELTAGQLAIFGDEGSGKYVEVLDPASGKRLSHTRMTP